MSKRYICSRCGLQQTTKTDWHLMTHKVHPALPEPYWIDCADCRRCTEQGPPERVLLLTKAEDDPDGPIDDPEVV